MEIKIIKTKTQRIKMQEEQEKKGQPIGRRIFKLITNGKLVFGECETVTTKKWSN